MGDQSDPCSIVLSDNLCRHREKACERLDNASQWRKASGPEMQTGTGLPPPRGASAMLKDVEAMTFGTELCELGQPFRSPAVVFVSINATMHRAVVGLGSGRKVKAHPLASLEPGQYALPQSLR